MGKFIADTPIKLGKCVRCGAYVFAADVSGLRVMADPEPLDADGVRTALVGRRDVFRVQTVAGRPHKLLAAQEAHYAKIGEHQWVGGHGCGVSGRDAARVEDVPIPPPSALATHGARKGGLPRQSHPAPAATSVSSSATTKASRSPAKPVTAPLSDSPCWECGGDVTEPPYVGVEYDGTWWYLRHDECDPC